MSSLPGMEGDFAKGASGPGSVYDTSPTGLGLNPAYLAGGAVASSSSVSGSSPPGTILAYGGSSAPAGYVLCDGSTYDGTTATYQNLYAAIGTNFGGTGASSFKVPDLQGRVPVGKGTNASVNALGTNDGQSVANRRPQHRHTPHVHGPASGSDFIDGTEQLGSVAAGTLHGGSHASTQTASADGGSGVSTDALDAPSFLVINYIIAL